MFPEAMLLRRGSQFDGGYGPDGETYTGREAETFTQARAYHALPPDATVESVAGGHPVPADEIGADIRIGGEPVYGPVATDEGDPAVAFDGTNYLVVWEDIRSEDSWDIFGARVSPAGSLLDTAGIVIAVAIEAQWYPAVAFDGTNYLVVWEDYRNTQEYSNSDIYGARVGVDGSVLDPGGIVICHDLSDQCAPAISFDGTNYLVVWHDNRLDYPYSWDIYGARVGVDGGVLDPGGIPISTATENQGWPRVAFDGTNYLVVWHDYRSAYSWDIYGGRVSVDGSVLDTAGIAISTVAESQGFPDVAFDGTNYLVAWQDGRCGSSWDIYGARVGVDGSVADSAGIAISDAVNHQSSPRVAFCGSNYLVVWEDQRSGALDVYVARVSVKGELLDSEGVVISSAVSDQCVPALACDGVNCLAVWQDRRSGAWDIIGARVSPDGTVLDPGGIDIVVAANRQWYPAVAFDGTNYLVVWQDDRSGSWDIYGARVSVDGSVLDPEGILISAATNRQMFPAVAFGGTNYLVVWQDVRSDSSHDIYGARVSVEGEVLDPEGIAITVAANRQGWPAVASDGTNCLVVWNDRRSGSEDIYGARVSAEGEVLDPEGMNISVAPDDQYGCKVEFGGGNYLVVWYDYRLGTLPHIFGARVSADGEVLDPEGIAIMIARRGEMSPDVAFDGTNFFVVWQDWRYGTSDIFGAGVSTEGTVLDPDGVAITISSGDQLVPAVAFDGTHYLVVWESKWWVIPDIYGARVTTQRQLVTPQPLVISTAPYGQYCPALAGGVTCTALIAYISLVGPECGSHRIVGNIWKGPTAIAFASASATANQGKVTLTWQMAVETLASSFVIQRSESPGGGYITLDLPILKGAGFTFSCTDCSVQPGKTYWYMIMLGDVSGGETYGPIEVRVDAVPNAYSAYQGYPNPFNPVCTIRYDIPTACGVSLRVFDAGGSAVRTLVDGWRTPGVYREIWDGRADDGILVPSGVYFYRLEACDFIATRKLVLLR
jgi:phosphoribosylformylglycinamidine (FGAM) synthase PurS component